MRDRAHGTEASRREAPLSSLDRVNENQAMGGRRSGVGRSVAKSTEFEA